MRDWRIDALFVASLLPLMLACDRPSSRAAESAVIDSVSSAPPLAAVDSGAPRLPPQDDANESFRAFRQQALDALARRDTAFLYSIVAREIRVSFGSGGGINDFKEMWKAGDPTSGVWRTLTRILRMGGKHSSDTMFTAPYVFASWPDSLDAFEHVAVTTSQAPVFSALLHAVNRPRLSHSLHPEGPGMDGPYFHSIGYR